MDGVDAPHRASFGLSLLVALGWYATVIAAIVVGWLGIPAAPNQDCSEAFSCLTPQENISLMLIFGIYNIPILGCLLFITAVVTGQLVRRVPSSILTGTLSALGSVGVMALADAVWQGVR
jgi:hypothetical protein